MEVIFESVLISNDFLEKIMNILKIEFKRNGSIKMGYVDVNGNVLYSDGEIGNIKDMIYFKKFILGENYIDDFIVNENKIVMIIIYLVLVKFDNLIVGVLVFVRDGMELSEMIKKIVFGKIGSVYMINNKSNSIVYMDLSMLLN